MGGCASTSSLTGDPNATALALVALGPTAAADALTHAAEDLSSANTARRRAAVKTLFGACIDHGRALVVSTPGVVDAIVAHTRDATADARTRELTMVMMSNLADAEDLAPQLWRTPGFTRTCVDAARSGPTITMHVYGLGALTNLLELRELAVVSLDEYPDLLATTLEVLAHPSKFGDAVETAWRVLEQLAKQPEHQVRLVHTPNLVQLAITRFMSTTLEHGGGKFTREANIGLTLACRREAMKLLGQLAEHPDNKSALLEWPGLVEAATKVRRTFDAEMNAELDALQSKKKTRDDTWRPDYVDETLALVTQTFLHRIGAAPRPQFATLTYTTRHYMAGGAIGMGMAMEQVLIPMDGRLRVPPPGSPMEAPTKVVFQDGNRIEMRFVRADLVG